MRHAAPFAAVLAFLATPLCLAQEPPAWAGHFVSEGPGDLELVLAPGGDGVVGALTRGASVFELQGRAQDGGVEGTSRVFSDDHPGRRETVAFAAKALDDGAIGLTVAGAEARLVRVAGSPSTGDALVAVIERLLSPGGVEENHASAVLMLSQLVTVQATLGEQGFATFEELARLGHIDAALARGVRKGYRFTLSLSPAKDRWLVTASPLGPDTGRLHFAASNEGLVREAKTAFKPNDACELLNDSPTRAAGSAPATTGLSHVRVGQRYVFVMTNAGAPKMEMIYTVKELGDGFVKYDTVVCMDMGQGLAPVGEPNPMEWRLDPNQQAMPAPEPGKAQLMRENATISGLTFDCLVVTSGNSSTWVPMTGDLPTFPGLIKSRTDGQTIIELVRIE